jgi:Sigma-70, region 4
MDIPDRRRRELDFDVRAILHAEIDRLAESERLAVVLVDLEGLTYEQAAGRLRWTVPKVCHRLARARKRLRERLSRRGVTATALGVVMASSSATAAVPAPWARAAVAAATNGPTSASVIALAQAILNSMLLSNLKMAAVALLAAAMIVSAGIVAFVRGHGPADHPGPAPPAAAPVNTAKSLPKTAPPRLVPRATIELRGRVVGPDGRPVSGAVLHTGWLWNNEAENRSQPDPTSGPEGRFVVRIARPVHDSTMLYGIPMYPWVAATSPGFGAGMALGPYEPDALNEMTVRLVEDGPPIEGQIVDLEGRPIAGAGVKVTRIWYGDGLELSGVIARNTEGVIRNIWDGLKHIQTTITTATGPDGRFRLAGVGRDRLADILVSGPTIVTSRLFAMSRSGPEARCINRWPETEAVVFHAPRFVHVAAPIKPIEGIVRDKDSGRPIAGVKITGNIVDENSNRIWPAPGVESITDAAGRYRLAGLPRSDAYRIFVEPNEGLPYIKATFVKKARAHGLDPVNFDIGLKRGVMVRGRVTDKTTGKPAPGFVQSFTFDNPTVAEFPGYNGIPARVTIKDDGRFEVVAMPGRGIIACHCDSRLYRRAAGAGAIKGHDARSDSFSTRPSTCSVGYYHALAEVNLDSGVESATVDLQVDPGCSVLINIVGPDGNPIGGTKVAGISDVHRTAEYEIESSVFEAHVFGPSSPRRVIVRLAGRKLIGSVYLKGDEVRPLAVRLEPWGTIVGRLVDNDGKPRLGLGLWSADHSHAAKPEEYGVIPGGDRGEGIWIGPDGRFRFDGLVPGLKYGASAMDGVIQKIGELCHDVTVAPGEVKDLGDLKVVAGAGDRS